jgi:hypothetical protein
MLFVMEKPLIGCSGARLQKSVLGNFDRSTFQDFRISKLFLMKFAIPLLLTYKTQKTQKLTKTSENNKAKGLTNANQGVQIHNILHSSNTSKLTFC